MESEIWKDAKGYQGDYSISTMGVIKSMKSGKESPRLDRTREGDWLIWYGNKNRKYFKI